MPIPLVVLPEHGCTYLPDRLATTRAFYADGDIPPELYHHFMDAGFRRSGRLVYQPVCCGCRECLMIRLPVARFAASKSQRRCWNKNLDLIVTSAPPQPTDEKFALYRRYQHEWHQRPADDRSGFESFLYDSPVNTLEYCYRNAAGDLLGVGICDLCNQSFSSVYFYHDPAEARRGLGTFSAIYEIQHARALGIEHYYLGYWVQGCPAMQYKANFKPCEVLHPDGVWREVDNAGVPPSAGNAA